MFVEILALLVAILAILFMGFTIKTKIMPVSSGNKRMTEIAGHIKDGAMTFISREYKYIAMFVVIVSILIAIFLGIKIMLCYILGSVFSMLAGYIGMRVSTAANARCANMALEEGTSGALNVAFSGGSVMGFAVTGLGFLGIMPVSYTHLTLPTICSV